MESLGKKEAETACKTPSTDWMHELKTPKQTPSLNKRIQ